MNTNEVWETPEKIQAEMDRLLEELPGWDRPTAHGVVLVSEDQTGVRFPVVNVEAHYFPAVVMSVITGRVLGTLTYEISREDLERAVAMVAPAEAAQMYRHPNLKAWRSMLASHDLAAGHRLFTVFVSSLDDPISSPYDAALRDLIGGGVLCLAPLPARYFVLAIAVSILTARRTTVVPATAAAAHA